MFSPRSARAGHAGVSRCNRRRTGQDPGPARPDPGPRSFLPRSARPDCLPAESAGTHLRDPGPHGVPPSDVRPGGMVDTDLDILATALFVKIDDLLKSFAATGTVASDGGDNAAAQRCRAGDPGDDAGDARIHVRGPVAPPRPCPSAAPVPRTCPSSPATTSDCARPPNCVRQVTRDTGHGHARCGPTTSGWWTPPRSNAAAPGRRSSAPTWPDGPSTATAPVHSRYFWGLRLHLVCTLARPADRVRADRRQGRRTRGAAATCSPPSPNSSPAGPARR